MLHGAIVLAVLLFQLVLDGRERGMLTERGKTMEQTNGVCCQVDRATRQ